MNPVEIYYSTLPSDTLYYAGYDEESFEFNDITYEAQLFYEDSIQPASFADPEDFTDA